MFNGADNVAVDVDVAIGIAMSVDVRAKRLM